LLAKYIFIFLGYFCGYRWQKYTVTAVTYASLDQILCLNKVRLVQKFKYISFKATLINSVGYVLEVIKKRYYE